jgi:hypothetical protein
MNRQHEHTVLMSPTVLRIGIAATALTDRETLSRLRSERGEGVISAAIAVLIIAFLGALMWVAFKGIWEDTEQKTQEQVGQIGS